METSGPGLIPIPNVYRPTLEKVYTSIKHRKELLIIEIGMTRSWNSVGDGNSTPYFAWVAQQTNSSFISVDNDGNVINVCKHILEAYQLQNYATLLVREGINYLQALAQNSVSIDILYLDALDYFPHQQADSEIWHLEAVSAIYNCIPVGGYVLIDDMEPPNENNSLFTGKGKLAVPYLLDNNFRLVECTNVAWLEKIL